MKVLLVSANKEKSFRPALPLGMITLAKELEKNGYQQCCVDLCFEDGMDSLKQALERFNPDVIGISIRNIDYQSFLEPVFNIPFVREIVEVCRMLKPKCKIVLGGASFTLVPEEIMSYVPADFGIVGPGERNFVELLALMNSNGKMEEIPGLVYRLLDGKIVVNPIGEDYTEFGEAPTEDRLLYDHRYFDYVFKGPTPIEVAADTVLSKRGCPQSCIYCVNSIIAGTKLKLKDPGQTVDEIEDIIKLGKAQRFEFADGAFNMPYDHALQVCQEMARRKIKMPWNCMFSPGAYSRELLDLMVATGCDLLELGTEAGSDAILRKLDKNFSVSNIRELHKMIDERGMKAEHCIFIGSPGETKQTLLETLDVMEELVPGEVSSPHRLYITLGYRIFRGTKLYNIALEEKIIAGSDNLAVPKYYINPDILEDSLLDLIEKRIVSNANWYLWWGIPAISLKHRVKQVKSEYSNMDTVFAEVVGE